VLETYEDSAPGEPPAEPHHEDQFPWLDDPVTQVLIQGNADGSRGGIAVTVEIQKEPLLGDTGFFRDEIYDPDIGLVGDDMVELVRLYARFGRHFLDDLGDHVGCENKDSFP